MSNQVDITTSNVFLLQKHLISRWKRFITLPDGVPDTTTRYFNYLDEIFIVPPMLSRQSNDIEVQRKNDEMYQKISLNDRILRLISSKSLSFDTCPSYIAKKNIRNLINILVISQGVSALSSKSSIFADLVSKFLISDIPEQLKIVRMPSGYRFSKRDKYLPMIQLLDQMVYLGYMGETMAKNIIEYHKISDSRYDFTLHPAERHLSYFREYGIHPLRMPLDVPLFIFAENYFDHVDDERKITDPDEILKGKEIMRDLSPRVIKSISF